MYLRTFFMLALILFSFGTTSHSNAQIPAEFAAGSIVSSGNGPLTAAQSGRLLLNASGTSYTTPNTTVSITASVSNQQFAGSGTGSGNPVVMFGATVNGSGGSAAPRPTYATMTDIGSPANAYYSNMVDGAASGIDVNTNLAFNMFTSVHQWAGAASAPSTNNTRVYMGDLTMTFSTPLTNPLMHIVGLGGTASGGLGFSSELDMTTAGLTLTKLQGNPDLTVNSTQIKNTNTSGITASCAANAACGTVRINGNNIHSVTFKVYVRGDNGAANWGSTASHAGDQWLLGFSIPQTFTISGNIFNDTNGLNDNTVNGNGVNSASGTQLYANMVEPVSGKIIGSTPINAGGTYSFNGVPNGTSVRIEISKTQGAALTDSPTADLPANWSYTGENIGTIAGSDGTADGKITTTITSNVTNANFGIKNLAPTAALAKVAGRVMTSGGRGIINVRVTITDASGNARTTLTTAYGNFLFDDVEVGSTYIVTATAKHYTFSQPMQILNINEETDQVFFIANLEKRFRVF